MENKFVVGEKAYILKLYFGRNHEPEIKEVLVEKIGRKYIYVSGVYETKFSALPPYRNDYYMDVQLCSSREEAEKYIECRKMRLQLRNMDFSNLNYNALKAILSLCNSEEVEEDHVFSVGDIVYVSESNLESEKENGERIHENFFGKVKEVYDTHIVVDWGNDRKWIYLAKELSLAKGLRYMTLEDFSNTFGVCVNATFL